MNAAALREVQAELVHAVSRAGGSAPLTAVVTGVRPRDLDAAVADLESAGILEPCGDGVLRFGPRGSVLSVEEVARHLRTRVLGRPVEMLAAVTSTNDVVLERAGAGAPRGLSLAAELQTEGRGRRGRRFDSRPGLGIWSTTLLDAPPDPAAAPRLSILAAVAVADAVALVTGERSTVKWPNDVQLRGRKICGVLVEARSVGRGMVPVAGIGLNVHHRPEDFPEEIRDRAGSLAGESGPKLSRSRVFAALLDHLERVLEEDRAGSLCLPSRFAALDDLRDREVVLKDRDTVRHGTARGVDADGCLLLEDAGRITTVRGGEVTLRPA